MSALGHYAVGNSCFTSKVDALLYGAATAQQVRWWFHDEVFNAYDWTVEPQPSLDDLYARRARELRESYDYLILSYSGGSDTQNILETFLSNGIHLDEVVCNHLTEATKHWTVLDNRATDAWNFAAEHDLQAVPRLRELAARAPKTKITLLDVSKHVLDSVAEMDDPAWALKRNEHLSPGQLFRYDYWHWAEMMRTFERGKRVAIIVGIDKPKTRIDDGQFWMSFADSAVNITTIREWNSDHHNVETEPFYWSPTAVDLLCKQAHVIRRWLRATPSMRPYWERPSFSVMRKVHEQVLRTVVYSNWDQRWFQAVKSDTMWNTEFDAWLRADRQHQDAMVGWRRGIAHLAQALPDGSIIERRGMPDGIKPFVKRYTIGQA